MTIEKRIEQLQKEIIRSELKAEVRSNAELAGIKKTLALLERANAKVDELTTGVRTMRHPLV